MNIETRSLVEFYLTNKKQRERLWDVLVNEEHINFKVVQGEHQYQELEQQLSQLQQEKEELKKEYRIANKDNKKLYDESMITIKYWQEEYKQLQQEKEELKDKLKHIHFLIHNSYIFGLRHRETIVSKIFQEIDDTIDEPFKLKEEL